MAVTLDGMQYHPWRRLAQLSDWLLGWAHLRGEHRGLTHFDAKVIVLDKRLTQAERRASLTHEICHIERGPSLPGLEAREEEIVHRMAARRLIPFHRLVEAMVWSLDRHEIADELWVDVPTLEARIRGLHPAERAALARALEHHHASA